LDLKKDVSPVNDNNYSVELFQGAQGELEKAVLFHSGYLGSRKIADLKICKILPSQAGNDLPTKIECHDGAWRDSYRVEFGLGGFLPTIGAAVVFDNGPTSEARLAELSCKKVN
jgi:hypothetical protein